MNRYLSSFLITTAIYITLIASIVIFSPKSENISDKTVDKPNLISVSMLAQPKVVQKTIKPKPKAKPKSKPKPKTKPKPKPKIKPKTKPKPKPKKVLPLQKEKKEEVVEEEVVVKKEIEKKEVTKEPVLTPQTETKKQVITQNEAKINHDEIKAKQNIFYTKIRNRINQNKSYPRVARRRGIEGEVEVNFSIQRDGNVKEIEFLSGKRIFKKSIEKAIQDSFPMEVDSSLFKFPKKFKITVKYILS